MESLLSTTPEQDTAAADKATAKELFQKHGIGDSVRDAVVDRPVKAEEPEGEVRDRSSEGVGALMKTLQGEGPAAEPEAKDETPEAEAEGQPEAKAEGESGKTGGGEDTEKARRYLTLKGLPASALDAMSQEELAAVRASHLEADRQRAKALEEAAALQAELERQKTETAEEAEPQGMLPAATEDLDAQLQKLVDDGELSEEAAKTLAEGLKARDAAILDQVQARLAPIEERTESAKAAEMARVERVKESVRAELGERFPGLGDSDSWDSINENLRLLAGKSKYEQMFAREGLEPTVRAMVEAAARLDGLEEIDLDEERKNKERRRADRDGGQPSTGSTKTSGKASGDSKDRQKFSAILRKHRGPGGAW